jgi:hypothetical protein
MRFTAASAGTRTTYPRPVLALEAVGVQQREERRKFSSLPACGVAVINSR